MVAADRSGFEAESTSNFTFDMLAIDPVRFRAAFELLLADSFGRYFDGHELNVQLEVNVTYSRWWFAQRISDSQQVARYVFYLPDSGSAIIQRVE